MDNDTFQNNNPQSNQKPKAPKTPWVLTVIFIIAAVAGFSMYLVAQKQLNETRSAKAATEQRLSEKETSLKKAEAKLKAAVILPTKNEMSPQCNSGSNDQTKLAPVNSVPIAGYNVYLVNCLSELVQGQSNTGKVIAFKVDSDGKQTFQFGAGSGEPYCISGKILPPAAAASISTATGIPICKTF